jgi:hypothetical protein
VRQNPFAIDVGKSNTKNKKGFSSSSLEIHNAITVKVDSIYVARTTDFCPPL